jgi:hypothetical protein
MILTVAAAAGAMFLNDVTAVLLVQAEARNRAVLAAVFDSVMWLASIATTAISVTALQQDHLSGKMAVLAAVELANVAGCIVGVRIGKRFIRQDRCGCACAGCADPADATPAGLLLSSTSRPGAPTARRVLLFLH